MVNSAKAIRRYATKPKKSQPHSRTYTRFAWAGGTFFPVVLLCQFFVLAGNRIWLYILLSTILRVPYSCGVVLVFFGSGGKLFLVLRTYLVYNTVAVVSFLLLWRES